MGSHFLASAGFLAACHELESLALLQAAGAAISSAALRSSIRLFSSLKDLDLTGCPAVTDEIVRLLALGCRRLRSLNVSHCAGVTEVACKHLASRHRPGLVPPLGKAHSPLLRIDVSGCKGVGDDGVSALINGCPALESLWIAGTSAGDAAFVCDAGTASALRTLDILWLSGEQLTDTGLHWLSQAAPNLQRLVARNCGGITDSGVGLLMKRCWRSLAVLDVRGCTGVNGAFLADVAEARHLATARNPAISVTRGRVDITCTVEQAFSVGLLALFLDGCCLDDGQLLQLPLAAPSLSLLSMVGCGSISGPTVCAIASGCKSLRVLKLSEHSRNSHASPAYGCHLDIPSLESLGRLTFGLHSLIAAGRRGMTVAGLRALLPCFDSSPILASLVCLNIANCQGVTDAGLRRIAAACPNMRTLILAGIKTISDRGVIDLAKHCKSIRSLSLRHCGGKPVDEAAAMVSAHPVDCRITTASILALAEHCPHLADLDVSIARDDALMLRHVEAKAPNAVNKDTFAVLKSTAASISLLITDAAVIALSKGCPRLQRLILDNQPRLTSASLSGFGAHSTPLVQTLSCTGCTGVASSAIADLAAGLQLARLRDDARGLVPASQHSQNTATVASRVPTSTKTEGKSEIRRPAKLRQDPYSSADAFELYRDIADVPILASLLDHLKKEAQDAGLWCCDVVDAGTGGTELSSVERSVQCADGVRLPVAVLSATLNNSTPTSPSPAPSAARDASRTLYIHDRALRRNSYAGATLQLHPSQADVASSALEHSLAASVLQRTWRCFAATSALRQLQKRNGAFVAVARIRARAVLSRFVCMAVRMKRARRHWRRMRQAATVIQRAWRAHKARKMLRCLRQQRDRWAAASSVISGMYRRWRDANARRFDRYQARRIRLNGLIARVIRRRLAATDVARVVSRYHSRRQARAAFANRSCCAMLIQRSWRRFTLRRERQKLRARHHASATVIQKHWRGLIGRKYSTSQRRLHSRRANATVVLQAFFRRLKVKRAQNQVAAAAAQHKAAVVIAAAWSVNAIEDKLSPRHQLRCQGAASNNPGVVAHGDATTQIQVA